MRTSNHLTAVFEPGENGWYIGYIPEMPGVSTQGESLEATKENLLDALTLMLEVRRELAEKTEPIGIVREHLFLDAA
jgi:predicted RNase H-like HicB family nuclease